MTRISHSQFYAVHFAAVLFPQLSLQLKTDISVKCWPKCVNNKQESDVENWKTSKVCVYCKYTVLDVLYVGGICMCE